MSETVYRKLGIEKPKDLNSDFDGIFEKYKEKALQAGLGELKFVKERGKVIVFAELFDKSEDTDDRLGVGGDSKSFTSFFD